MTGIEARAEFSVDGIRYDVGVIDSYLIDNLLDTWRITIKSLVVPTDTYEAAIDYLMWNSDSRPMHFWLEIAYGNNSSSYHFSSAILRSMNTVHEFVEFSFDVFDDEEK